MLLDEPPLVVQPTLTKLKAYLHGPEKGLVQLGLERSVILQQMHWWCEHNRERDKRMYQRDGYWWTTNTVKNWVSGTFKWTSIRTFERHIKSLNDAGILIVTSFPQAEKTTANWYRPDLDEIQYLMEVQGLWKKGIRQNGGTYGGIRQNGGHDPSNWRFPSLYKRIKETIYNHSLSTSMLDLEADAARFGAIADREHYYQRAEDFYFAAGCAWLEPEEHKALMRALGYSIWCLEHQGKDVPTKERARELFQKLKEEIYT